jgi:hypothetical protein
MVSGEGLNMKVELTRSGGIYANIKKASAEVDWTDDDLQELIAAVKEPENAALRDAVYYTIDANNQSVPVSLQNIPDKYKADFDALLKEFKT